MKNSERPKPNGKVTGKPHALKPKRVRPVYTRPRDIVPHDPGAGLSEASAFEERMNAGWYDDPF